MRLSWKDAAATMFMAINTLVYVAYLRGADLPLVSSTRATTAVVLLLGIVGGCALGQAGERYGHDDGSERAYVAVASLFGTVALLAALAGLVLGSEVALGVLFTATAALWLMATVRHALATAGGHLVHR